MEGRTSASSGHISFRIPKKKPNIRSEDVQVQSPLTRLPGSHHWVYPLKEWRLSARNRVSSTKRRQRDCDRCSCNDEESFGQPKVILTNVLRTKIGRKYAQVQPKTDANFSDADKLQSDQLPSSSVASLKIWQILNPTLQSLFLSKRQPKVILTNVLRMKIGRKYINSHVIIDANLSDADKLQSGQPPSSSVASLQTCQILNPPHESSFLSKRSEHCLRKRDDGPCKLTEPSKESESNNFVFAFRKRELQKKENKNYVEVDKRNKNMNSTSLSWKGSDSFDSEKKKRRLSDDDNAHIPEKSLLPSLLMESVEDKCPVTLPSGSTPSEQMNPALEIAFASLYIGRFKWSSTGHARFTTKYIMIPFQVALNKNIKLTVDTLDLRRFGLWRSDGGCSSKTIIFLWLSTDYVEKIETQLGKSVFSKPSKPSEFVFLELSQPLTEWEEVRLTELITDVSKKNRAPDLSEFLSLKQALPFFKDLSAEESSFMSYSKDLLKQCMLKENTSNVHEPEFQESKPKVARPSYALANKQNSGCYSISLSSALNEEWKEVREAGAVKNLIVYPPPPAKGGLGVTREDLECLEYGEFLNDVIIDFYLKYLLLEKAPKHLADRTHIFSSFFYKCLTRTEKNSEGDPKVTAAQRRHKRVRTWTRHINIFSKDYIFVPVNEESHWYIAVICFPWLEEAVYEECPNQTSLYHQLQQSPLQSEKESQSTRTSSVLAFPNNCKDEEMDANRSLFSKGGNHVAAVLHLDISKNSPSNSRRQICKRPCILILDSLKAGSLQNTVQVLREYLEAEWEAKRKTHREFSKSTMIDFCPRVPKQDNSSDCGVYLLQYVESFFQNPIDNFEQPMHLEKWFPRQVIRSKREEIRDLILQLHFQQHSGGSS
ncbi:sentrin-specific protease 7 isoform X7 [Apteryx mantelli]|uniref:Sentrin-specific protease 7 isoform X7 n=1 Tax=Apteryx mantelli TaxID=2696672 RepID=A0ABM4EWS8_9AVES